MWEHFGNKCPYILIFNVLLTFFISIFSPFLLRVYLPISCLNNFLFETDTSRKVLNISVQSASSGDNLGSLQFTEDKLVA